LPAPKRQLTGAAIRSAEGTAAPLRSQIGQPNGGIEIENLGASIG
jgi:hypothetical protein